jgi:hypothetical protein
MPITIFHDSGSACCFIDGKNIIFCLLFSRGGGAALLGAAVVVGLPEYV